MSRKKAKKNLSPFALAVSRRVTTAVEASNSAWTARLKACADDAERIAGLTLGRRREELANSYHGAIADFASRWLGGSKVGGLVVESVARVNKQFDPIDWREGKDDNDLLEINTRYYFEALYAAIRSDSLLDKCGAPTREAVWKLIIKIDDLNKSLEIMFPMDHRTFLLQIHYEPGEFPLVEQTSEAA